jgi:hypothetical protein
LILPKRTPAELSSDLNRAFSNVPARILSALLKDRKNGRQAHTWYSVHVLLTDARIDPGSRSTYQLENITLTD